jgi:hypothetical protein
MNSSNIFFRFLAFIIGVAIFAFYIYVINNFTTGNIFEFPYLLLTIYFAFCIILFPFIAFTENEMMEKLKFLPNTFIQMGMFIIAPYLFIKHLTKESTYEN